MQQSRQASDECRGESAQAWDYTRAQPVCSPHDPRFMGILLSLELTGQTMANGFCTFLNMPLGLINLQHRLAPLRLPGTCRPSCGRRAVARSESGRHCHDALEHRSFDRKSPQSRPPRSAQCSHCYSSLVHASALVFWARRHANACWAGRWRDGER